jgi:cytochrome c oxidase subunit IV
MSHLSYEASKKLVYKGLIILAVVTLAEVFISLIGKGHLWGGIVEYRWLVILSSVVIVTLSIYKAYYIIYNFMHMKYEVPELARTVLLPTALLIWAMIAFFWEGADWQKRRAFVQQNAQEDVKSSEQMQEGTLIRELETSDFQ